MHFYIVVKRYVLYTYSHNNNKNKSNTTTPKFGRRPPLLGA